MHDNFWHHARQEKTEEAEREFEVGPIVSILHHLQRISFKIDLAIEVHLMERLHRDLGLAMVSCTILLLLEAEVMLHRTTRIASLLVFAG